MSDSSLISGYLLSPNCSKPRNHVIDRITPHYMAAYSTAKACCEWFSKLSTRASANYCIGYEGEIWLCVNEANRAWTTGSSYNDNRAVTIECANMLNGQLTDATWNSLVKLCADICTRNGIARINYTGNDKGNLTMHKWYQDTDCPGPWLSQRFDELANEINAKLNSRSYFGVYRCNVDTLNIREAPSLDSAIVGQYHRGETVTLDNFRIIHEGYVWGRYTGFTSGKKRYVAIGPYTGKDETTDYLIRT